MSNGITRRDFLNGIAIAVLSSAGIDLSAAHGPDLSAASPYPPARGGLRGSHVGSFEAAHRLRDGGAFDLSRATVEERYGIAPGNTMDDIVLARFDYEQIDRPEHPVRIRLSSTAVDVRNVPQGVEVAYVSGGKLARVGARDCVLACYQAMTLYRLRNRRRASAPRCTRTSGRRWCT